MRLIDPKSGKVNPKALGGSKILFKPSAKPGDTGMFFMSGEAMHKLANTHIANDLASALDILLQRIAQYHNELEPQHLPKPQKWYDYLVPRKIRFYYYRRGIEQVLHELCAEDYIKLDNES